MATDFIECLNESDSVISLILAFFVGSPTPFGKSFGNANEHIESVSYPFNEIGDACGKGSFSSFST
ncbi:hypothetical protein BpHYR1_047815 [Brachionus plicatilis]|uniref:Uncharacterized protein n=1 Tax=Brachionus plicatilis TaxID=10195 RepID=A0A3M7QZ50_BRAPC|nr:hypothetical protein BpHYR1_047815 [Brachionus plicatilis]